MYVDNKSKKKKKKKIPFFNISKMFSKATLLNDYTTVPNVTPSANRKIQRGQKRFIQSVV